MRLECENPCELELGAGEDVLIWAIGSGQDTKIRSQNGKLEVLEGDEWRPLKPMRDE